MTTLKLKVFLLKNGTKCSVFSKEEWEETTIIYEKLVRNLKEEMKSLEITNFDKSKPPFITMEVNSTKDLKDEDLTYIADYLSGNETENPVYIDEEEFSTESSIILSDREENFIDRFNKIVLDIGV